MASSKHEHGTTVDPGAAGADEVVEWSRSAAGGDPWAGLRGLDLVQPGIEAATTTGLVLDRLADPADEVLTWSRKGEIAALTTLWVKQMETEHFGIVTGGLSNVLSPPSTPDRHQAVEHLLRYGADVADSRGIELLVLRVDADDVDTLVAAQDVGFTVYETTTTWLLDAHQGRDDADATLDITCHTGPVKDLLPPGFVDGLADAAARWGLGHLCVDRRIPEEGVRSFYRAMIDNVVSGRWGDYLYLARSGGTVAALSAELSDPQVRRHSGANVLNTEWWAVLEPGSGVGKAMTHQVSRITDRDARYRSWETQVRNFPTTRCIVHTGIARPIRSAYTLHRWS